MDKELRPLYEVWDEITYPFPNFNGATVEVCKWIYNFIPHLTMLVKGSPEIHTNILFARLNDRMGGNEMIVK